jgi:hypothetical protein
MHTKRYGLVILLCIWGLVSLACNNEVQSLLGTQTAVLRSATAAKWTMTASRTARSTATSTELPSETLLPSDTPTLPPDRRIVETGQTENNIAYSFSFNLAPFWGVYANKPGDPHLIGCPDFPVHIPCYIQWIPDQAVGKTIDAYAQEVVQALQKSRASRSWTQISNGAFAMDDSSMEAVLVRAKFFYLGDDFKSDLFFFKKDNRVLQGIFTRRMYMDEAADADVERMMKSCQFIN